MQRLIIYGARYTNLISLIEAINRGRQYRLAGFIDDAAELQGATVTGYPVFGGRAAIAQYAADCVFAHNVQGSCARARARAVAQAIADRGGRLLARLVHPDVDLFDVAQPH